MADLKVKKIRELSIAQLLAGSFALTYYVLSGLMVGALLFFNRFLIDTGHYDNGLKAIQTNSLVLVLALIMLVVVGAIAGLVLFLINKSHGLLLFVISAIILMAFQAVFSGLDGWQKFVVEIFLIIVLMILPSKRVKPSNLDKKGED
jgi:hypothetical protein